MATIAERKSEAINLRMSPCTKELLRLVAEREHLTLSNMLEVLILEHAVKLRVNREPLTLGGEAPSGQSRARLKECLESSLAE